MSTTVSYKGSTLTTVNNQIRTLLTKNKYMEDNVILTDVSGGSANLQAKTAVPSTAVQTIAADSGYDALSSVEIAAIPSQYIIPAGTIAITSNGSVDVSAYATASVSVQGATSSDFIITLSYDSINDLYVPDKTLTEIATAYSDGKTIALSYDWENDPMPVQGYYYPGDEEEPEAFYYSVVVYFDYYSVYKFYILDENGVTYDEDWKYTNVMFTTATASDVVSGKYFFTEDGTYTQGTIITKTSSDITASGSVVSVPSGFYASTASKAIAAGAVAVPTTTITANPTLSINNSGLVTASVAAASTVAPTVTAGYVSTGTSGAMNVSGSSTLQLTTQTAATITPSESQQTAVASGKYTTGNVVVAAISADYVGSGVSRKSSADLTASSSTITAPAGYYASAASKTVSAGTTGTPIATKGTVSNHQVSVTPSVTNTTGWITGSTKTGTAVTVSASELVSGTSAITTNGSYDVTNYATVSVNVSTPTFVTYYTGTAAPTAGLGSNGDIYLQTSS